MLYVFYSASECQQATDTAAVMWYCRTGIHPFSYSSINITLCARFAHDKFFCII